MRSATRSSAALVSAIAAGRSRRRFGELSGSSRMSGHVIHCTSSIAAHPEEGLSNPGAEPGASKVRLEGSQHSQF